MWFTMQSVLEKKGHLYSTYMLLVLALFSIYQISFENTLYMNMAGSSHLLPTTSSIYLINHQGNVKLIYTGGKVYICTCM